MICKSSLSNARLTLVTALSIPWLLTACAAATIVWALRDGIAARRLARVGILREAAAVR